MFPEAILTICVKANASLALCCVLAFAIPETSEPLAEITTVILQSRLPAGARSGTVVEAISAWPKSEDAVPPGGSTRGPRRRG